jgi:hypothetical protein
VNLFTVNPITYWAVFISCQVTAHAIILISFSAIDVTEMQRNLSKLVKIMYNDYQLFFMCFMLFLF